MKKLLFVLLLFANTVIFANTASGYHTRPTKAQIDKDINSQKMDKYKDHFEVLSPATFAKKHLLSSAFAALIPSDSNTTDIKDYITDNTDFSSISSFSNAVDCSKMVNLT